MKVQAALLVDEVTQTGQLFDITGTPITIINTANLPSRVTAKFFFVFEMSPDEMHGDVTLGYEFEGPDSDAAATGDFTFRALPPEEWSQGAPFYWAFDATVEFDVTFVGPHVFRLIDPDGAELTTVRFGVRLQ